MPNADVVCSKCRCKPNLYASNEINNNLYDTCNAFDLGIPDLSSSTSKSRKLDFVKDTDVDHVYYECGDFQQPQEVVTVTLDSKPSKFSSKFATIREECYGDI